MRIQLSQLKSLLVVLFALCVGAATAQDTPFSDLPPTSEYGKCYAKCKVPDVYETVSVQKLKKEASTKLIKVPAVYEDATETVLVKEAGVNYVRKGGRASTDANGNRIYVPTYSIVTEQVMVTPAKTVLKTIPAKYRTETRQVLESPARGQWVRKKKSPSCFSQNPDDCYVACYEEIPAKYRTEKYQVLESAATTTERTIPAVYKTVSKKVLESEPTFEAVPYEAEYKTVTKKVLVSAETTRQETIPAEYTSISEKRLVSEGGFTVWTEILCAERQTNSKVASVQRALAAAGYNPGPIDGVMGLRTQTALKQYQQDKGLPMGNLNLETLNSLGVSQ